MIGADYANNELYGLMTVAGAESGDGAEIAPLHPGINPAIAARVIEGQSGRCILPNNHPRPSAITTAV